MLRISLVSLVLVFASSAAGAFEVDETLKEDRETLQRVQTELTELDYSPGVIDGIFGGNMQRAIESFHADQASDLTVGLTAEMVDRIGDAHASWYAAPDYVRADFLAAPENVFSVDITDLDPNCNIPDCTISMFLLAADDLTGDGAPDLVIGTIQSDDQYRDTGEPSPLVILVNDGAGNFSHLNPKSLSLAPRRVHPREAAVADFNGDNVKDLFVAAHGLDRDPFPGESNLLMLSDGNGGLKDVSDRNLEPLSAMNHGVVAHNVDGDGDTDLLVITNAGANTVDPYFLINDGARFTRSDEEERLTSSLRTFLENRDDRSKSTTARFADVNADGYSDLIFAISGDDGDRATRYPGMRRTRVVLNDRGNHWLKDNAFELPARRWGYWTYTTDVDAGDIDNDGDIDLLLTESTRNRDQGRWGGQHHQLFLNDGGTFSDATTTHLWNQGYPELLAFTFPINSFLVDLDLDKDLDIVVQTLDPAWKDDKPDEVRMLVALNDGSGHFTAVDPRRLGPRGYEARQLRPADVDGDGDVDLIALKLDGRMLDDEFYTGGFTVQVLRNRSKETAAKE